MHHACMHTHAMKYALGTSVGERGQITIERDIRRKLGIRPKDLAVQRIEDGRLVVEFVRHEEPHDRSLTGILGPSPARPPEPRDVDEAVGESIAREWRDYVEREAAELDAAPTRTDRRRRAR